MTKRLISFFLTLVLLVAIPLSADYRYNPYTRKLDYYEPGAATLGAIPDVTLTGLANGDLLYYNGTAWVNLTIGAGATVLTVVAGIPSWAAPGAPAAHAASHEVGGADLVDHDQLTNYLAAQHLTLPNTIVAVLTDHNKATHDALLIDADTVDGEHAAAIVTNARVKAHFPDTIANILSDHNLLAHTALGLFDASSDVDHDATTNYLAAQHLTLPSTIAAVLTDHNLAAHTALGIPDPANVFYISATGGDYATIQAALNAQNAGGETFLVGPGSYADTITFTANDQVVKPLGEVANVIVTQADANIVDGGAWSDCIVEGIEIRLTAPTTAINAIQVGTGDLTMLNCRGYLATAVALVQADQPSLVGFTGAGQINLVRGRYEYYHTGNTGAGGIKAAFRANVNLALLHLHKIDQTIITNSGTALVSSIFVTTGTAVTEVHNNIMCTITDPNATLVVGLGYVGGGAAHNIQGNHVDVVATNNTAYGLYHNGTATIRSGFNAIHASDVAGASYAFYVGGAATLNSHFDDLRSDDGNTIVGTFVAVNSETDGDLTITNPVSIYSLSHNSFTNYVANQHINWTAAASNFSTSEDFFLAWTEPADHAAITQTSGTGIENQALILIDDDRADSDEGIEAALVIDSDGVYSLYLQGGHFLNDMVSYFEGDTYQKEDVFISWIDAADHMAIVQQSVDGTEDQALIQISDARVGATATELSEATLRIDTGGVYAFYISDGYAYFGDDTTQIEDIFWTWADAADHAVIHQAAVAGIAGQPLIFIDDDRTGVTANEPSEATLRIDGDGVYSLVIVDGYTELNDNLLARGQAWFYSIINLEPNLALYMGGQSGTIWKPTINGAADTIFWWGTGLLVAADETKAIFYNDLEPAGDTAHDNYVAPTLVIANDEGADANDYAGVVIGERTQADVKVAHYFDFYAMTGAVDGSVDPSNAELAATFRFGDTGTTVPTYATGPGDVLFEDDIEVVGTSHKLGDTTNYEDVFWTWADTADHAVIAQSNAAGTEDVPLIFIDDDRTGATATELSEATINIDAEGVYAMALMDGELYVADDVNLGSGVIDPTLGGLTIQTSAAATPTTVDIKGNDPAIGTGFLSVYDEGQDEALQFTCFNGTGWIQTIGAAPGNLLLMGAVPSDIKCWWSIATGNPWFYIYGGMGGPQAYLRTGVDSSGNSNIEPEYDLSILKGDGVFSLTVDFDDADPTVLCTVADGYVITDCWIEVIVAWDGNGYIEVGDGGDDDGFMTSTNYDDSTPGYYGHDITDRGAYLLNGLQYIYTGADTIDIKVNTGTSTQGQATVYVHITRLK